MKAIKTKYLGATRFQQARIVASDMDGSRVVIPYESNTLSGADAHNKAALALMNKMEWTGKTISGQLDKNTYVHVFVE